ncbi:adenylosuccinate lyase [Tenacibaculum sp. IB213877]|uniref:adenylosuccinate lyase n=1 Tax=Tenacibaculum sp. IB213877 TaxID=3097351 RepID=UPI002A59B9B7|nr:adenylosuccinate lyase [Tenacibaculum sp. IB213877]MDY0781455.1 adenylosuccinate lyase [Tenacibaculum sp. IB213877]
MKEDFLTSTLTNVQNAARENREKAANTVLTHTELFSQLVEYTFKTDDKLSIKAAWILEWICTHYGLDKLLPHLEYFTKNLHTLQFDSATRPCAKICEHIAIAYDLEQEHPIKSNLTSEQIDKIIEVGFDWLMGNQKIAVKAYTMTTLFLFGKQIDWVHPELEHIIKTKVIHESKGCEARGKHVLRLIEKQKL